MILEKKEEISEFLEKNLEIDPKKKDIFGEVNTPEILIHDMLDKIPESIWKDPTKKWLDPASGIGSFPIFVYERLLKNLQSWEPNFQKRHRHIIENMLYMCEINPENVKKAKKIFGEKANIQKCDFLDSKYPNFPINTFDIIIGNPPFNASQEAIGKKGGGNSLWPDFVEKTLSLLEKNGLLVFVHPSTWRKPEKKGENDSSLFKKMTREHQIEYLEIHSKHDGLKMFGVQTRYDWYVLKNTLCFKKTLIKDETGKLLYIDLRNWDFLPNCYYGEVKRLLSKTNTIDVIYSRNQFGTDKEWIKEKESKEYKYPLVHSTPMGEARFYWTNIEIPNIKTTVEMFGQKKVIFGESGINDVILDIYGKYGMTQGAIGLKIENKKQGLLFKKGLESEGFERILKALNFGNFRIDWRIFLYIRKDFYNFLGKLENKKRENSRKKKTLKKNKTMKKYL